MAHQPQIPQQPVDSDPSLPQVLEPSTIDKSKVTFWAFLKEKHEGILFTGLAYLTGRLAERFLPNRWGNRHTHIIANVAGVVVGTYEAYKLWGKSEKKRLRVDDINKDIYTVYSPEELKSQTDQVDHIQDGIKKILAGGTPASHADALTGEAGSREMQR